jgi:hypothetical protein
MGVTCPDSKDLRLTVCGPNGDIAATASWDVGAAFSPTLLMMLDWPRKEHADVGMRTVNWPGPRFLLTFSYAGKGVGCSCEIIDST